jgi:acyl-CoA synthetase (AMP-forming)/AMP-acid ligase II
MRLVHHYLIEAAQKCAERAAIVSDERMLSYAGFVEKMSALSVLLADAGVRKGDRALILLRDKADFLMACYAVFACEAIAVPLPEDVSSSAVDQITKDCTPLILITSLRDLAEFPLLHDKLNCSVCLIENSRRVVSPRGISQVFVFDKESKYRGANHRESPNTSEDTGALILYTSGTTGRKEGALLSHRNLIQGALNVNALIGRSSNIREFVAIPLVHSFGFSRSVCIFLLGGTIAVNNGTLNPMGLVQTVLNHGCDAISALPSGFAMFFGRLEFLLKRVSEQIRLVELASVSMPLDHQMKLLDIFPNARICMHYGAVEASSNTFIELGKEQRKLHTVGRPSPNVAIAIGDDQGKKLGPLQIGEILVRGDHVATQYWQNQAATMKRFTLDNWFKTGDYGFLDEEGYLHLLGRKDEMINMDGIMISSLEVEDRIREAYPDSEICVVGVPDPAGIVGEIPVLCYAAKNSGTITPSDLSRVLSARLDRNQIPRIVYRVDSLPRTEDGKVSRRELRKKIIAGSVHKVEPVE